MSLAEFVRLSRERAGLSQQELAVRCGTAQSTVAAIEVGRILMPGLSLRRQLAGALGTTNVALLIAGEQLTVEELRAWVRQSGPGWGEEYEIGALGESYMALARLSAESPWVQLAMLLPELTQREAETLVAMTEYLPTSQAARRRRHAEQRRDAEERAEREIKRAEVQTGKISFEDYTKWEDSRTMERLL